MKLYGEKVDPYDPDLLVTDDRSFWQNPTFVRKLFHPEEFETNTTIKQKEKDNYYPINNC